MATFTNFFTATIYGYIATEDGINGGPQIVAFGGPSYQAFGHDQIKIGAIQPAQSITCARSNITATVNSYIEVFPHGLNQPSKKLVTDSTFAQLNTGGA